MKTASLAKEDLIRWITVENGFIQHPNNIEKLRNKIEEIEAASKESREPDGYLIDGNFHKEMNSYAGDQIVQPLYFSPIPVKEEAKIKDGFQEYLDEEIRFCEHQILNVAMLEIDRDQKRGALIALKDAFSEYKKLLKEEAIEVTDELKRIVFESLGEVSMCWTPRPSSQVFDSTKAMEIGDKLVEDLRSLYEGKKGGKNG
ncbi:MAG: hypothetical protein V4721_10500 [Bacteroidota bacterium]